MEVNASLRSASGHDFTLFYEDLAVECVKPLTACMCINEISPFDGLLVATTLSSAFSLAKSVSKAKKAFYVWDLEWLRNKPRSKDYLLNMEIYRNPELKLIARSEHHAKAIADYCNRKPDVVCEDFNLQQLIGL